MAIELKQTIKLSQQLLITPQLQQAIKLLQLSRMELIETVQKELMENPVLEESEEREPNVDESREKADRDAADRLTDLNTSPENEPADPRGDSPTDSKELTDAKEFDWSSYLESSANSSREPRSFADSSEELPNYENMVSSATTLQDHLEWQIKMGSISDKEEEICITLIGNLDDNGYLQSSLEELDEKNTFTFDEFEDALCIIQELDPPGVGARNLKECLKIQVRDMGTDRQILTEIVDKHLNLIEKRNYQSLSKKLALTLSRSKHLAEVIFSLEPKPGRSFGRGEAQYITPDVYVKKIGEDYVVVLNEDGLPKLQISNFYKSAIMKEKATSQEAKKENNPNNPNKNNNNLDNEAQNYIQEKLKSALWLIKSIHQRQKTLYKVTKAIASFQESFLDKGVQSLRPLVLRDVADNIGVHESTVSRATNGKYVHTPQGIFELKYFFNTGLANVQGGQDFANEAVKQMINQFISNEDCKSPLSDQAIATILKRQNINIARRTVAKYREMLGILPSSRRKRLY